MQKTQLSHKGVSLALCLVLLVLCAVQSAAQSGSSESCDVTVVVTQINRTSGTIELAKDLGPSNFAVQIAGVPESAESAMIDSGPKRVALVVDASANIPRDEWELQIELAVSLASNARPSDTFVLELVGAENNNESFLSRAQVQEQLRRLLSSRPAVAGATERVYDALMQAAIRLNPPAFGDAVFLIGRAEDVGSKTDIDMLQEAILREGLRFYGFSLSSPLEGRLPPGFNPNARLPASVTFPQLADVSAATGYFISFHSLRDIKRPGQIQLFENFLADWYASIAAPYRLRIPSAALRGKTKLQIALTNFSGFRTDAHYPQFIYPCD
jgi:hypothetical protein